jgi:peptide/nickel transport system substrate-binding protein
MTTRLSRRDLLRSVAFASAGALLAACQPKVIRETVVVEKEVEKVVEQTVVVKEAVEVEKEVTRIVEKEVVATPIPAPAGPAGKIVVARGGNLRHSNPWGGGLYEGETANHMYEGLYRTIPNTSTVIGVLAKEWNQSEDGLTWTFNLHEGIKFANGEEVTAHDFRASYEALHSDPTLQQHAYVYPKLSLENIVDVDAYTFTIKTEEPYPSIFLVPTILCASRKAIEADPEHFSEKAGAGSGPWQLTSWSREGLTMEPNPLYRDPSVVRIKDFEYRFIGEEATKLAALKAGEVDVVDQVPFEQVDGLESDPRFKIQYSRALDMMHLNINCGEPPFDNPEARKAAMYAVDRQVLVDTVLGGAAETAIQPQPEGYMGHNPDLEVFPYDPEKSKQILQAAGFTLPVKIQLIQPNAWFPKVMEVPQAIAAQMGPAGFDVEVVVLEGGAFTAARQGSNYNLAFMQYGSSFDADGCYAGRVLDDNWGTKWQTRPESEPVTELLL